MRAVARYLWKALPSPVRGSLKRAHRSRAYPGHWLTAMRAARILLVDYGFLRSIAGRAPVDARGRELPWYSYPAIEYITQLDFSDAAVFEFGAGYSSLFWARRARRVVSVEEDEAWYREVVGRLPPHCEVRFEPDLDRYADAILATGERFDVIVIDGGDRYKCAQRVGRALKPGGLVILDNSDWAPESSRVLRALGLIEVDMFGFTPGNSFTGATSFYFDRMFARRPGTSTGRSP
jgi:hypothetical protein